MEDTIGIAKNQIVDKPRRVGMTAIDIIKNQMAEKLGEFKRLGEKLKEARRRSFLTCGCGKRNQVKNTAALENFWYEDYDWSHSHDSWECGYCGKENRFPSDSGLSGDLFKSFEKIYED